MLRKILGIIAGVITAGVVIMIMEMISHSMYPMPEGLELTDTEALRAHIESLPMGAYLMLILGYVLGAFSGGLVSTLVSKVKYMPAIIIGVLLSLGALANGMMMPQPVWISVVSVLVMIPFAYLGARMVKSAA